MLTCSLTMQRDNNKQRERKLQEFYIRRACAGAASLTFKVTDICRATQLSRHQLSYWRRKVTDPLFHPQSWGGKRYTKYSTGDQMKLEMAIWEIMKDDPSKHLEEICRSLNDLYNLDVKPDWVKDLFHSWRWSWKIAAYKQVHKYTMENIKYYEEFLKAIIFLPLIKLKFLDEVSFAKKDVRRRRAVGKAGKPVLMNERTYLNTATLSAIVLTGIDTRMQPIVGTMKPETNTHADFNKFVHWCVNENLLQDGDYLILDNSRVHTSNEGFTELVSYLQKAGVKLKLLPKYSPELNPIELVFGFVKHILRNYYCSDKPLKEQILAAFGLVTRDFVYRCYQHCLNPWKQIYH